MIPEQSTKMEVQRDFTFLVSSCHACNQTPKSDVQALPQEERNMLVVKQYNGSEADQVLRLLVKQLQKGGKGSVRDMADRIVIQSAKWA